MPLTAAPLRIAPRAVARLWGRTSLTPLFADSATGLEPIGEVWLTHREAPVVEGPLVGLTLDHAWQQMPPQWKGHGLQEERHFPLLAKFLFTSQSLSIQVHPDDHAAAVLEATGDAQGKTEMWHVVAADRDAEVYVGLRPGIGREQFCRAIANGTVVKCLQRWPVRPGDTVFLPAGTFHTCGPGLVLCEIQQYSDLTYRVFDYGRLGPDGRPRELHIEKALAVGRFAPAGGLVPAVRQPCAGGAVSYLLSCRYFSVERWDLTAAAEAEPSTESFDLLIVLAGSGRLQWENGETVYATGQCWFVPAHLGVYRTVPAQPTTLLRVSRLSPEEFLRRGRRQGVAAEALRRVVFV